MAKKNNLIHRQLIMPINKNRREHCVICRQETEYLYSTPIQERKCYIVGCGQLCAKCYRETVIR